MSARIVVPAALDPLALWGSSVLRCWLRDACVVGVNGANVTGTTPPALALSGNRTFAANMPGIRFECTVGGANPTLRYSVNNGASFIATISPTPGTPFALAGALTGTNVTAPVGTYNTNNVWRWGAEEWTDKSGNGNHFTQSGTLAPLPDASATGALNGNPSMFFAGTPTWLQAAAFAATLPSTLFMVYRTNTGGWTGGRNITAGSTVLCQVLQMNPTTPNILQNNGSMVNANNAAVINSWFRIGALWSNSFKDFMMIGARTQGGLSNSGSGTDTGRRIGTNAGGTTGPGMSCCEYWVLNRAPTLPELTSNAMYLSSRYGGSLGV